MPLAMSVRVSVRMSVRMSVSVGVTVASDTTHISTIGGPARRESVKRGHRGRVREGRQVAE